MTYESQYYELVYKKNFLVVHTDCCWNNMHVWLMESKQASNQGDSAEILYKQESSFLLS